MSGYDDDNIFAKILRGDVPGQPVFENDDALVIMDVMPQTKGHCLVIPKAASRNILDADDATLAKVMPVVASVARAARTAFEADGIRVAQFNEPAAGQTVFHLHFHILPMYEGVALTPHTGGMADPAMLAEQASAIRSALVT